MNLVVRWSDYSKNTKILNKVGEKTEEIPDEKYLPVTTESCFRHLNQTGSEMRLASGYEMK